MTSCGVIKRSLRSPISTRGPLREHTQQASPFRTLHVSGHASGRAFKLCRPSYPYVMDYASALARGTATWQCQINVKLSLL